MTDKELVEAMLKRAGMAFELYPARIVDGGLFDHSYDTLWVENVRMTFDSKGALASLSGSA
jgi:hypothetical protein